MTTKFLIGGTLMQPLKRTTVKREKLRWWLTGKARCLLGRERRGTPFRAREVFRRDLGSIDWPSVPECDITTPEHTNVCFPC